MTVAPPSPNEIQDLLEAQLPDVKWTVNGDGYQYMVQGVGEFFAGLNAVKRQQAVYKVLNPMIANGSLHAVTIKTYTDAEFAAL
ncbi:BolA family protein [Oceanobacter mangrovi]|uniref:BolA family protein n=1 Tax=Oceanobacter mangrovi TaxID=2862510 RepID=UPI001C8EDE3C|nr:BolA/IbaG family iron-sulfur metabolism protein [Oceanobacter mangrovi]